MIVPSWQQTLIALYGAETVEDLWAVLLAPHGFRSIAAWDEPFELFRRFHEDDGDDAAVTALLLCTDHRWRLGAHRLVNALAGSTWLDGLALDLLAWWFLEDELVCCVSSRSDARLEVDVSGDRSRREGESIVLDHEPDRVAADHVTVRREIWPPLRRWAAARSVARAPDQWRGLLDLAGTLAGRDGAAVAAGVMDAIDAVRSGDRSALFEAGLSWGSGVVRLAELPGLARHEGVEIARARAAADPSATVRAWAPRTEAPASPAREPRSRAGSARPTPTAQSAGQPTLFEL